MDGCTKKTFGITHTRTHTTYKYIKPLYAVVVAGVAVGGRAPFEDPPIVCIMLTNRSAAAWSGLVLETAAAGAGTTTLSSSVSMGEMASEEEEEEGGMDADREEVMEEKEASSMLLLPWEKGSWEEEEARVEQTEAPSKVVAPREELRRRLLGERSLLLPTLSCIEACIMAEEEEEEEEEKEEEEEEETAAAAGGGAEEEAEEDESRRKKGAGRALSPRRSRPWSSRTGLMARAAAAEAREEGAPLPLLPSSFPAAATRWCMELLPWGCCWGWYWKASCPSLRPWVLYPASL